MDYDELDMPKVIRLNRGWLSYLGAAVLLLWAGYGVIHSVLLRDMELLSLTVPLGILFLVGAVFILLQVRYSCVMVRPCGMTIRRCLWLTVIDHISWNCITGVLWHGGIAGWGGHWEVHYEDESGQSKIAFVDALSRRSYEQVQRLMGGIIQRRGLSETTVPHIPWWHLWRPRPKRIWRKEDPSSDGAERG